MSDNGEEGFGDFERDDVENNGLTYKSQVHQRIDSFGANLNN